MSVSIAAASLVVGSGRPTAQPGNAGPLLLEAKIPLGEVRGRIDHMAIDLGSGSSSQSSAMTPSGSWISRRSFR